jgi:hypothetical protein
MTKIFHLISVFRWNDLVYASNGQVFANKMAETLFLFFYWNLVLLNIACEK